MTDATAAAAPADPTPPDPGLEAAAPPEAAAALETTPESHELDIAP